MNALFKGLLQLSTYEDVATFVGETGANTILKEVKTHIDTPSTVETGTVSTFPSLINNLY